MLKVGNYYEVFNVWELHALVKSVVINVTNVTLDYHSLIITMTKISNIKESLPTFLKWTNKTN